MLHLKGELIEQLSKELSGKWLSSSPINSAKIYTSSEAECVLAGFIFTDHQAFVCSNRSLL